MTRAPLRRATDRGPVRSAFPIPVLGAASLALAAILLAGCVTESVARTSRTGVPLRPSGEPANLAGVASPSPGALSSARARFEVQPLGVIAYDGLTLPLVSPDARFIASQINAPPSWPAILALPGDARSELCRVRIYTLADGAPRVSESSGDLARGLILGRSADEAGFLVEAPQPDGARWIGRVDWATGALSWLIKEDAIVAAHAILLRDGTLVYCRRAVDAYRFKLVIVPPASPAGSAPVAEPITVETPDSVSLLFPIATPSQRHVGAFCVGAPADGLVLGSISLLPQDRGRIVARIRLGNSIQPQEALQCSASVEAAPAPVDPAATGSNLFAPWADAFVVVAPRWGSAAIFSAITGEVVRPDAKALGVTLLLGAETPGALISTSRELFFAPAGVVSRPAEGGLGQASAMALAAAARVLPEPLITRSIHGGRSALGFGPDDRSAEPGLRVWGLRPVGP